MKSMTNLIPHNCPVNGLMGIEEGKPCNWCNQLDRISRGLPMITKNELDRIDQLRICKEKYQEILQAMQRNKYVFCRAGLVDINSGSPYETKKSEHADFFHSQMKDLEEKLTDIVIKHLEHQVSVFDLELSQYISDNNKVHGL